MSDPMFEIEKALTTEEVEALDKKLRAEFGDRISGISHAQPRRALKPVVIVHFQPVEDEVTRARAIIDQETQVKIAQEITPNG